MLALAAVLVWLLVLGLGGAARGVVLYDAELARLVGGRGKTWRCSGAGEFLGFERKPVCAEHGNWVGCRGEVHGNVGGAVGLAAACLVWVVARARGQSWKTRRWLVGQIGALVWSDLLPDLVVGWCDAIF